jgi:hypothetical protein
VLGLCGPAADVDWDHNILIELVLSAAREIRTNAERGAGELFDGLERPSTYVAPIGIGLGRESDAWAPPCRQSSRRA